MSGASPSSPAARVEPPHRYAAFISYRHVEPDRRWARWLHRALEAYQVPRALGRARELPRRIGRVFRDEEELSASADLSAEIRSALEQSRFLVVVCSPRTPASVWVNREVELFRELGRHDRILALLVEGEPRDSFPRALCQIRRAIVDPAAGAVGERVEDVEPLAADVRPGAGRRSQIRRTAVLRLMAAILGVPYDDLRRREGERRARRLTALTAVVLGVALAMSALAIYARVQQSRAELSAHEAAVQRDLARDNAAEATRQGELAKAKEREAIDRLSRFYEAQGRQLLLDHYPIRALPLLAEAYQTAGTAMPAITALSAAPAAAPRLGLAINLGATLDTAVAIEAAAVHHTGDVMATRLSPDGRRMITVTENNLHSAFDLATGRLLAAAQAAPGRDDLPSALSADASRWIRLTRGAANQAVLTYHVLASEPRAVELKVPVPDEDFDPVQWAVISPDGRSVAARTWQRVVVWRVGEDGRIVATGIPVPLATVVHRLIFAPNSDRLIVLRGERPEPVVLELWDTSTAASVALVASLSLAGADALNVGVDPLPDGRRWLVSNVIGDGKQLALSLRSLVDASQIASLTLPGALAGPRVPTPAFDARGDNFAVFLSTGAHVVRADPGTGSLTAMAPFVPRDRLAHDVGLSADASRLLVGGHLVALPEGREILVQDYSAPFDSRAAALAPDGSAAAFVSGRRHIKVVEAAEPGRVRHLDAHAADIRAITFSPDSRLLLSSGRDGVALAWDWRAAAMDAEFNVEARLMSSFPQDGLITTAPPLFILAAGSRRLVHVGSRFVGGSQAPQRELTVWSTLEGRSVAHAVHPGHYVCGAASADGTLLATGANDGKLRIWNLADATIVGEFDLAASLEDVGRVEFPCPWAFRGTTDQVLLTAAGVVVLVNARTGDVLASRSELLPEGRVISTSDGSRAAHLTTGAIEFLGITADGRFDPGVSKVVRDPDFSSIMPAEFSPDGRSLAVATGAALRLSDAAGGAPRLASGADFATVKAMSFASDSTWIAVAGNDGVVHIIAAADGRVVATLDRPTEHRSNKTAIEEMPGFDITGEEGYSLEAVRFAMGDRLIVTIDHDRVLRVFELASRSLIQQSEVIGTTTNMPMALEWIPGDASDSGTLVVMRSEGTLQTLRLRAESRGSASLQRFVLDHSPYRLDDGQVVESR